MHKTTRICDVDKCGLRHQGLGYCNMHYQRFKKHGDPLGVASAAHVEDRPDITCSYCHKTLNAGMFAKGAWKVCRTCRSEMYLKNHYTLGRTCASCDAPIMNVSKTGHCRAHYPRKRAAAKRYLNPGGYVIWTQQHGHPNSFDRGVLLEHVMVMSGMLQRALRPGENVHHLNGVRDDNRPENLELWSVSQPAGQRIPDKVAWAKELLALYEPEALRDGRSKTRRQAAR